MHLVLQGIDLPLSLGEMFQERFGLHIATYRACCISGKKALYVLAACLRTRRRCGCIHVYLNKKKVCHHTRLSSHGMGEIDGMKVIQKE